MRACFLKNNICALGYGLATVRARTEMDTPLAVLPPKADESQTEEAPQETDFQPPEKLS